MSLLSFLNTTSISTLLTGIHRETNTVLINPYLLSTSLYIMPLIVCSLLELLSSIFRYDRQNMKYEVAITVPNCHIRELNHVMRWINGYQRTVEKISNPVSAASFFWDKLSKHQQLQSLLNMDWRTIPLNVPFWFSAIRCFRIVPVFFIWLYCVDCGEIHFLDIIAFIKFSRMHHKVAFLTLFK